MKKLLGFGLLVLLIGMVVSALTVLLYPMPEPNDIAVAEISEIRYADGTSLIVQIGDVTRTSVPLSDVPEHVQLAVLAAEDREFYSHEGFSPEGLARAVVNNASGGSTQGGSTITQQYVKNAFLTHDQTLSRKARELIISLRLELSDSKGQILEGYLNTIYFGRGAYGIEAASQAYFGHPASELTLVEGAALAGIIQSPGNFEPEVNPQGLQGRFDYVVAGMVAQGSITAAEAEAMALPAFLPRDTSDRYGGQIGYIAQEVRAELLAAGFTDAQIDGGGLRISTTIDQAAQDAMVAAVEGQGPRSGTEGLRIGAASVDPTTGGILAMYGGADYVSSPLNNATQARSQAGSTFKPFALAAAFEEGISPYSRWNGNSPRTIAGYKLENEGNTSYGTVTLQRATEKSINTAFVALAHQVGIEDVMDAAYRAGVPRDTTSPDAGLSFVLGSSSTSPLEMASAYATFAARGVYRTPHIVQQVTTSDGQVLYEAPVTGEQRFDPDIADQVNAVLQKVVTNGTATKARALNRPVAGKTGTTDDNKSAWFVGYTPQAATAVMLTKEDAAGNPVSLRGTGGLTQVFGSSFPLNIWVAYNAGYLDDLPIAKFVAPVSGSRSSTSGDAPTYRRQWTAPPSSTASDEPEPIPFTPEPSTSPPDTGPPDTGPPATQPPATQPPATAEETPGEGVGGSSEGQPGGGGVQEEEVGDAAP